MLSGHGSMIQQESNSHPRDTRLTEMFYLRPVKSAVETSSWYLAIEDHNAEDEEFLNFGDTYISTTDEIT